MKVAFKVIYNSSMTEKIGKFMSGCDLGIDEVIYPLTYIYSWETTSIVDKKYLEKMRRAIRKGIELEGGRVFKISKIKEL